ncbi:MAG: cobalamin-binding protein [Deltaproteobacteria bacterium]|nr:cobalamin-binding protein [Deltaproteobacteria bacterium]
MRRLALKPDTTAKKIAFLSVFFFLASLFTLSGQQSAARTMTDELGRKMTVPDDLKRVVSLAPSITEIVFSLGKEALLKGVSRFSDFPAAAEKLPGVGSYVHLDLEKIVALKPDLCIGIKDGNPIAVVKKLERLGIPVYAVDPRDLEAVLETIIQLGRLLGADQKAQAIVSDMRTRMERVKSLVATSPHKPRVFFQIGVSPIVSAGTQTYIHELILMAGGRNLAEGPVPYPRYSREQVLGLSPDVMIITSMARGASFERVKKQWSRWPSMPAVRDNRILLLDSNLCDRPTPRLIDGLEQVAEAIHPELYRKKP